MELNSLVKDKYTYATELSIKRPANIDIELQKKKQTITHVLLKHQVDQKENLDVIPDPLERTRSILEPGIVIKSPSPTRTVK